MKLVDLRNKINIKAIKIFLIENQILIIIGLIFALAIFLRFWNLGIIPGGFSAQEEETVKTIANLSKDNMWLDDGYFNAAYIYLAYLWSKIFGLTVLSLRALSAVIGSLTVVASYLFISKWFSKKIAIFMTLLFAVSSFHVAVSRLILPEILLPLVLLGLFLSLTYAYRTKNVWLFGFSGVLAGLGFYTSPAFFLTPLLFIFSGWYFYKKNKKFVLSYYQELIVALTGFLAVIIPYVVSFVRNPQSYLDYYNFSISLGNLTINISQISSILFLSGPKNVLYNVGSEPLLDPLIFVTSIAGLLFAVMAIQRRKYLFIVLWLFFLSVYASLKPNLTGVDLLGLLPVIYTFSALIIDYILDRWLETFPRNQKARIFAVGLMSVFFALSMMYNFDKYFVAYRYSNEVVSEFSAAAPIPLNNNN
jgi:4-amino-4-deoxy-L-arabinose transferase-like glycosyltransferase